MNKYISKSAQLRYVSFFALLFLLPTVSAEQVCLGSVLPTASSDEFVARDTGTVWHKRTQLIWMSCAIGQVWNEGECQGEAIQLNWKQALAISLGYDFDSSTQWRLPNVKELSSITEKSCVEPSVATDIFMNTPPDEFWTSTPSISDGFSAWALSFFNASASLRLKERTLHVRLVRTALPEERVE